MNRFAGFLQEMNARLDLPQPTKSRILLELAADLEDLYQFHCREGLTASDAMQRTLEKFAFSDEALGQLAQVHTTPFRRFFDRLSLQAQSRWERWALIGVLIVILALTGPQFLSTRVFAQANPLAWPLVASSAGALFIALQRIYVLYIKRDHEVRGLRMGLMSLIGLAIFDLLVGVVGFFAKSTVILGPLLRGETLGPGPSLVAWLIQALALMSIALTTALLTALIWFSLVSKVAAIERAAAAHLVRG